MKLAEGTKALGVRPVSQRKDRRPGEESSKDNKKLMRLDSAIEELRKKRFILALDKIGYK